MTKLPIKERGVEILKNPLLNKGTAFSEEERDQLGLNGLLPYHIATMEEQLSRRYDCFKSQHDAISKYIYLSSLQNRNETLFFRLVHDHIEEMLPLVYTPTVGDASQNFSAFFSQSRGVYFSYPLKDKIDDIVQNIPEENIDVIVVTDGERILGLGDLGAGGMAISVGKLALYSLFGGIHPARVLPVVLDVGTNNEALLNDPLYIGWRNPRIDGSEYEEFVEAFVKGIKKRWPNILLQWEDFSKNKAKKLLTRYQDEICSFNDDIQGTAAVVLASIFCAVKSAKTSIKDQKVVILGAGSAGMGICEQIHYAMVQEGLSPEEAYKNFYVLDRKGVIHSKRTGLDDHQMPFAQDYDELAKWDVENVENISLFEAVKNGKPTVLIGVSTVKDAFTQEIVEEMSRHVERPIILPLSNPTSKSEAHPEDLLKYTKGTAIIATGSPFGTVEYGGEGFPIAQCNNVYIFPGVGLGVIASGSKKVSDKMFLTAAQKLSEYSPMATDPKKALFPPLTELREVTREIAIAVALAAQEEGLADKIPLEELEKRVDANKWLPEYKTYTPA